MLDQIAHKPSPAERYIQTSVDLIGEMPADARLAKAIELLAQASALVSDFVDEAHK